MSTPSRGARIFFRILIIAAVIILILAGSAFFVVRHTARQAVGHALSGLFDSHTYESMTVRLFSGSVEIRSLHGERAGWILDAENSSVMLAFPDGAFSSFSQPYAPREIYVGFQADNLHLNDGSLSLEVSRLEVDGVLFAPLAAVWGDEPDRELMESLRTMDVRLTGVSHLGETGRFSFPSAEGRFSVAEGKGNMSVLDMQASGYISSDLPALGTDIPMVTLEVQGLFPASLDSTPLEVSITAENAVFHSDNDAFSGTLKDMRLDGQASSDAQGNIDFLPDRLAMSGAAFTIIDPAVPAQILENAGLSFLSPLSYLLPNAFKSIDSMKLAWDRAGGGKTISIDDFSSGFIRFQGTVGLREDRTEGEFLVGHLDRDVRSMLSFIFPFAMGTRFPATEKFSLTFSYDNIRHGLEALTVSPVQ